MKNGDMKKVMDYLIKERKNGLMISKWKTTEKSLIMWVGRVDDNLKFYDEKVIVPLSKILLEA